MRRLALMIGLAGTLSLAACRQHPSEAAAPADLAQHIISLERGALDRWIHADPDGYLALYAQDATYFDPFHDKRVDGLDQLTAMVAPLRGMTPPFTEPRYEMIDPRVDVSGDIAILTFNLVDHAKPTGSTQETVIASWNSTEIYRRIDGEWKIVHSHWSFTQPQPAATPP